MQLFSIIKHADDNMIKRIKQVVDKVADRVRKCIYEKKMTVRIQYLNNQRKLNILKKTDSTQIVCVCYYPRRDYCDIKYVSIYGSID